MCGICGVVKRRRVEPTDLATVRAMNGAMLHRGPDMDGLFESQNVILGMRRLSIIDLAGGHQPLFNEDRSLALVANGEIYNFVELRDELQSGGHTFGTHSDCETILHLYEDRGDGCVDYLRGMFAFALWDERRRRLLLARDRMGEKPLYLYETDGALYFASEMKAMLSSGVAAFDLDPTAVDLFLHYAYVPEPRSAVRNVRKLPAGHVLTVEAPTWDRRTSRYWSMEEAPPVDEAPVAAITQRMDEIGKLVVRSDVPVGVALSGGLDSSLVAALAAEKCGAGLAAFSVGYEGGASCDERQDAEALARHLKMPFFSIELSTDAMCEFFPDLNRWRDDPIADPAGYGYYAVMKLAREQSVPVILQGQGGDELFWGYDWMRGAARETEHRRRLAEHPLLGRIGLAASLRPKRPEGWAPWQLRRWGESGFGLIEDYHRIARIGRTPRNQFAFLGENPMFLDGDGVRAFYKEDVREQVELQAAVEIFSFPHPWPAADIRLTRLICETYLACNGIAQGDRLSMASSVEMRLPFVDFRLVETVIGLRKRYPDYRLGNKTWLREAARRWLPDWVISRPKRGFTPPMAEWMAALHRRYAGDLSDGHLVSSGFFDGDSMRALLQTRLAQQSPISLLFRLMVLESWCRAMASVARR